MSWMTTIQSNKNGFFSLPLHNFKERWDFTYLFACCCSTVVKIQWVLLDRSKVENVQKSLLLGVLLWFLICDCVLSSAPPICVLQCALSWGGDRNLLGRSVFWIGTVLREFCFCFLCMSALGMCCDFAAALTSSGVTSGVLSECLLGVSWMMRQEGSLGQEEWACAGLRLCIRDMQTFQPLDRVSLPVGLSSFPFESDLWLLRWVCSAVDPEPWEDDPSMYWFLWGIFF